MLTRVRMCAGSETTQSYFESSKKQGTTSAYGPDRARSHTSPVNAVQSLRHTI